MLKMYLSIPIRYCEQAGVIEAELLANNISVLNPCKLVPDNCLNADIPATVARSCWQMIDDSSGIILFADYYGRDCAAEIGYAIAQNKPIFPICFKQESPFLYNDWMIKSFVENTSFGLAILVENIQKKFILPLA